MLTYHCYPRALPTLSCPAGWTQLWQTQRWARGTWASQTPRRNLRLQSLPAPGNGRLEGTGEGRGGRRAPSPAGRAWSVDPSPGHSSVAGDRDEPRCCLPGTEGIPTASRRAGRGLPWRNRCCERGARRYRAQSQRHNAAGTRSKASHEASRLSRLTRARSQREQQRTGETRTEDGYLTPTTVGEVHLTCFQLRAVSQPSCRLQMSSPGSG